MRPHKSLNELILKNCQLNDIEGIEELNLLQSLNLSLNNFSFTEPIQLLWLLKKIKNLDISGNPLFIKPELIFPENIIVDLQDQKIEIINISSTQLEDEQLEKLLAIYISNVDSIKQLNLSKNQLTDASMPYLKEYLISNDENLENEGKHLKLDISYNQLKDNYEYLIFNPKIKDLKLGGNEIVFSHKTIDIASTSTLTHLDISNQSLKAQSIQDFIRLANYQSLTHLNFQNLGLTQVSTNHLLKQILINNLRIEYINFSYNNVGWKGCKVLNLIIQRIKKLRILLLDYANIQCVGLTYLWLALNDPNQEDLVLEHLSVRQNNINVQWAV
ncbi:UNKNOWN [Stylonychia lemnae]|uniref:Uncharacterized protein n=1 Tax=Stylonychia lemnae TaxID=5949 RepID=A0A078AA47_STYLE|nr:UNKNOWN [Stylonychia lemnae]|eukprot:CDW77688.1 UNKNOWN [Stylonychia lemnae]